MYKRLEKLKIIRRELENAKCLGAAQRISGLKSPDTLFRWRKPKGSRIDRYIIACQERSQERRDDAVEDKQFDRLIKGEASPAEYIFYLVNRRPKKWQNNYRVEHSGYINHLEYKFENNGSLLSERDKTILNANRNN